MCTSNKNVINHVCLGSYSWDLKLQLFVKLDVHLQLTLSYIIKMSGLLHQCLLLAMSDISDEELWDTSDESDTEHILLQLAAECVSIEERNNRTFGEKRIARYNDHQFVHHLSITKQLALSLSEKFEKSSYYQDIKDRGRHSLSAKNQLYVFLWFVTHQNLCYRDVGRYFGISLSTVHAILNRIGTFLCEFMPEIIKWPDQEERTITAENYYRKIGVMGIVGCVGTTLLKTDQLKKNDTASECVFLPVQAICNDENKFIDVYIGEPDNTLNTMFANSCLEEKLIQLNNDEHIVGDTSYPSLQNLIVPFTDGDVTLDESQQHYNQNLNFCIDQVQLCFTSLKERFRGLNCLKVRNTKLQHLIIKSCFVLYNLNYDAETQVGDDHNYTTQQIDMSNSLEVILTTENES